jgi:microcystin degradation protein MlrC
VLLAVAAVPVSLAAVTVALSMAFPAADFDECAPMVWGYGEHAQQAVQRLGDRVGEPAQWQLSTLDAADAVVFLQRPELAWDAGKVIAALRGQACAAADVDALLAALQAQARAGDHVVFMSNGGFDGAPRRFLAALQ